MKGFHVQEAPSSVCRWSCRVWCGAWSGPSAFVCASLAAAMASRPLRALGWLLSLQFPRQRGVFSRHDVSPQYVAVSRRSSACRRSLRQLVSSTFHWRLGSGQSGRSRVHSAGPRKTGAAVLDATKAMNSRCVTSIEAPRRDALGMLLGRCESFLCQGCPPRPRRWHGLDLTGSGCARCMCLGMHPAQCIASRKLELPSFSCVPSRAQDGGLVVFWNALSGSELYRLTAHEDRANLWA